MNLSIERKEMVGVAAVIDSEVVAATALQRKIHVSGEFSYYVFVNKKDYRMTIYGNVVGLTDYIATQNCIFSIRRDGAISVKNASFTAIQNIINFMEGLVIH